MEGLYFLLGWGSPVGTGFFLVCLGTFINLLAGAGEKKKTK